MPVKAKSKSISKASNKTTVIVNVGKSKRSTRSRKPKTVALPQIISQPPIINYANPGQDAMLRDIQYQMNKLNLASPIQSLSSTLPVAANPPPLPVVQEVEQAVKLPPIMGIGKSVSPARTPEPSFQSTFTNDIFQMTPRQPKAAPAASKDSLPYEDLAAKLEAIPMEKKIDKKTGRVEMKPKRGYGVIYNNLIKAQKKTIRMKK
jgi:hypothetical protein